MYRLAVVGLLVAGCSEPAAPMLNAEGDPCRGGGRACVDDTRVQECIEDLWVVVDCAARCGERSLVSLGCRPQKGTFQDCECAPPANAECSPGESECAVGDQDLLVCSEAFEWDTVPCADVCAANPIPQAPVGCIFEEHETFEMLDAAYCVCSAEGLSCPTEGEVLCADVDSVATCVGGLWAMEDCVCDAEEVALCDPLGPSGAACSCGS